MGGRGARVCEFICMNPNLKNFSVSEFVFL